MDDQEAIVDALRKPKDEYEMELETLKTARAKAYPNINPKVMRGEGKAKAAEPEEKVKDPYDTSLRGRLSHAFDYFAGR